MYGRGKTPEGPTSPMNVTWTSDSGRPVADTLPSRSKCRSLTSLAGKFSDSCERNRNGSSCGRVARSMRPVRL
ncbi:hypothetical protein D3C76_1744360 [compost metagenome]